MAIYVCLYWRVWVIPILYRSIHPQKGRWLTLVLIQNIKRTRKSLRSRGSREIWFKTLRAARVKWKHRCILQQRSDLRRLCIISQIATNWTLSKPITLRINAMENKFVNKGLVKPVRLGSLAKFCFDYKLNKCNF